MILTCPNCRVRFLLNPDVLGKRGRKLCCSSCSHIWFQTPEEDDGSGDSLVTENTDFQTTESGEGSNKTEEDTEPDFRFTSKEPEKPPTENNENNNKRQYIAVFSGYACAVALYLVFCLIIMLNRETVADIWQPSNILFEKLGFETANNLENKSTHMFGGYAKYDSRKSPANDENIKTMNFGWQTLNESAYDISINKAELKLLDENDENIKTMNFGWQTLNESAYDISINKAELKLLDENGKIFDIRELPVQENKIPPKSKPKFEYSIHGIRQDIVKSVRIEIKGNIL